MKLFLIETSCLVISISISGIKCNFSGVAVNIRILWSGHFNSTAPPVFVHLTINLHSMGPDHWHLNDFTSPITYVTFVIHNWRDPSNLFPYIFLSFTYYVKLCDLIPQVPLPTSAPVRVEIHLKAFQFILCRLNAWTRSNVTLSSDGFPLSTFCKFTGQCFRFQ